MASLSTTLQKIRILGQMESDIQVYAFIREVSTHANRDLKHKLIATVMAQPGAQCHDTRWIAKAALDSLVPKVVPSVPPVGRPQVDVKRVPDTKKLTVEYETCPACINRIEKGKLTTHFQSSHRSSQIVAKIKLLNNDALLNLLYDLRKSRTSAKLSSTSKTWHSVLPVAEKRFLAIENATIKWQRCFEGIANPPELEELRLKVMEVRSAINSSWIKFEVASSREAKAATKVPKAKTKTKAPKERKYRSSRSVWAIQCGHPGSGRGS